MTDDQAFFAFGEAAAEFLQRGLEFARRDSPELFRDCQELVADGRARVELVCEFHPLRVHLRLVDANGNAVADVFTCSARVARPEERLN